MRFGHILVCHSYPPDKLFNSISRVDNNPWFIFMHSQNEAVLASVKAFADRDNVSVFNFGTNRGLARSWNDGIVASLDARCEAVLILNDDIFFYDRAYSEFLWEAERIFEDDARASYVTCLGREAGASSRKGQVVPQDFSCVSIHSKIVETVGMFDENFFPAYYEDSDYDRRCILSGFRKRVIERALIEHERSSTVQGLSQPEKDDLAFAMRKNHSYYQRKWGTLEPLFETPFNQGFPLSISPEGRAKPYSEHDRQDRNVDAQLQTAIPSNHYGTIYTEVMRVLSQKRRSERYLEIGVNTGNLFQHIHADFAIGVDPEFTFTVNPMLNKRKTAFYQTTSDQFFSTHVEMDGIGKIDLAFLDGMHTFEFLLRDFFNTERLCTPRSLIAMHDCLPLNEEMTHRNFARSLEIGRESAHPLYWTGDVWKIIPILRKYRPDLKLIFVDAPPTGLVFVTKLDPRNTSLSDHYAEIVDDFRNVPSTAGQISQLYEEIEMTKTMDILNDYDHTLYFIN